jgi:sugar O-acyltransferase (sialic acid O-acetyltransferase NeuD family)
VNTETLILLGAGGHAKEVFDVLLRNGRDINHIEFADTSGSAESEQIVFGKRVMNSLNITENVYGFTVATGKPSLRKKLYEQGIQAKLTPRNVSASSAIISTHEFNPGKGLNIMENVFIGPQVQIGNGTLINSGAQIHHNSEIGDFCEICPGVIISGNCIIGNEVFIGSGAVIIPGVKVGNRAVIGAGAVVIHDVEENTRVVGVPACVK